MMSGQRSSQPPKNFPSRIAIRQRANAQQQQPQPYGWEPPENSSQQLDDSQQLSGSQRFSNLQQLNSWGQFPRPARNGSSVAGVGSNAIQLSSGGWSMMQRPVSASFMAQPYSSPMNLSSTPGIVSPISTATASDIHTVPAQVPHDEITNFTQAITGVVQRRNENSHLPSDFFDWNGDQLTNQGLPLDRQYAAGDNNLSSMDVCLESHPESFVDQQSGDFDDGSLQPSTPRPGPSNEYDYHNVHGYLDQGPQEPQNGHWSHATSHAPDLQTHHQCMTHLGLQPCHAAEHVLEQMVESLDALYQRNPMDLDVNRPDEPPQTPRNGPSNDATQKCSVQDRDAELLFMCPYAMRYPHRVKHSCFQRLKEISYLKQHLRHNHHDATSCPHRCSKSKTAILPQRGGLRRGRLNTALFFDESICLRINGQRSDRSKEPKQQWARIYRILFPGANHILNPYIQESTRRRLRTLFKFMENHGGECLATVYDRLPPLVKSVYPRPEVMYRVAFCKWLPRVLEQRFPPQGQRLLGDFLGQIESVLRDSPYTLPNVSGFVQQPHAPSAPISQPGTTPLQQPYYGAASVPYFAQQQSPLSAFMGVSPNEPQYSYSQLHTPSFPVVSQHPTDDDSTAPAPGEQASGLEFNFFLFDQCSPLSGSPSQMLVDFDGDISQTNPRDFSNG